MTDLEQNLREIFGDSIDRLGKFREDQLKKLTDKLRELAREAVRDEISRLNSEIADLRARVASLEKKS